MSQAQVDVTVIIVNWNAAAFLPAALDALRSAGRAWHLQVLLIDNASSDESLTVVRQGYPEVQVVENAVNDGFAAANNQGMALAAGRYLLLLNPDTELPPDALTDLIQYMDTHEHVGAIGPRLQGSGGKVQGGAAGYDPSPATIFNFSTFLYRLFPHHLRGLWLPRSLYEQADPIQVDWVSGACMMVRREVIASVGTMDERYFMYSEDVEWCRRMRKAGYAIVCLPSVHVVHHIGGSARQLGPEFYAHNVDSLDLDLRTRYSPVAVALMHAFGAMGFLLRFLMYELHWLREHNPVYEELRDLWGACLRTSLERMWRSAPRQAPEFQMVNRKQATS